MPARLLKRQGKSVGAVQDGGQQPGTPHIRARERSGRNDGCEGRRVRQHRGVQDGQGGNRERQSASDRHLRAAVQNEVNILFNFDLFYTFILLIVFVRDVKTVFFKFL